MAPVDGPGAGADTFSSQGPAAWLFVTDLFEWRVVPRVAVRRAGADAIVLQQREERVSLLKHCLAQKRELHCEGLASFGRHLWLAMPEAGSRDSVLGVLCEHAAPGCQEFLQAAGAAYEASCANKKDTLLKEPNWHLM